MIVLVNPNYQSEIRSVAQTSVGPPMGLAYLAGELRRSGREVRIVDANACGTDKAEAIREIGSLQPTVVGITATTATIHMADDLARGLRGSGYDVPVLVGGAHPTALPADTLREFGSFTAAVAGEAEGRISAVVDGVLGGGLDGIPGVAFRDGRHIRWNEGIPEPPDVDALAPPARNLLPDHRYTCPDGGRAATVIANRGCPAPCTYCLVPHHFGRKIRRRTPDTVVDEMSALVEDGATWINFIDDTFTWDPEWVEAVCEAIRQRGLVRWMRWQCLTRVDRVEPGMLAAMKRAGCGRIEMGIECASEDGLRALRKKIDRRQVVKAFDAARQAGLETLAFAMLNVPGETLKDIAATGDLLIRIDPDWLQLSYCTPYPGTPLWTQALEQGRLRTRDWREYRFLRRPVLDNGVLTEDEVIRARRRLLRRFWLRPRSVWRVSRRLVGSRGARWTTLKAAAGGLRQLFGDDPVPHA